MWALSGVQGLFACIPMVMTRLYFNGDGEQLWAACQCVMQAWQGHLVLSCYTSEPLCGLKLCTQLTNF